jgi:hypothetical protein
MARMSKRVGTLIFAHWQRTLRLQDVDFDITWNVANDGTTLMRVAPACEGDNLHAFSIEVTRRGALSPLQDFYEAACHELLHALSWHYTHVVAVCEPYLPAEALAVAQEMERRSSESHAYKLAPVFCALSPIPEDIVREHNKPRARRKEVDAVG